MNNRDKIHRLKALRVLGAIREGFVCRYSCSVCMEENDYIRPACRKVAEALGVIR